jgi:lipid-A-disaccharide synthase-like uncharacterized protein
MHKKHKERSNDESVIAYFSMGIGLDAKMLTSTAVLVYYKAIRPARRPNLPEVFWE